MTHTPNGWPRPYGATLPVRTLALLALLMPGLACQKPPGEDLLAKGETLCLDAKWDEAQVVLKRLLRENPLDAGGHFYLGRCYMLSRQDFRPLMAIGEFQTALRLFKQNGGASPIERFSDDYFEFICDLESTKVRLFEIERLREYGFELARLQYLVEEGKEFFLRARKIMPDDEDVIAIGALLDALDLKKSKT